MLTGANENGGKGVQKRDGSVNERLVVTLWCSVFSGAWVVCRSAATASEGCHGLPRHHSLTRPS